MLASPDKSCDNRAYELREPPRRLSSFSLLPRPLFLSCPASPFLFFSPKKRARMQPSNEAFFLFFLFFFFPSTEQARLPVSNPASRRRRGDARGRRNPRVRHASDAHATPRAWAAGNFTRIFTRGTPVLSGNLSTRWDIEIGEIGELLQGSIIYRL